MATAALVTALVPAASAIPIAAAEEQPAGDALMVRVAGGLLQGERHENTRLFQGIPFAAPPVGDLRWRAPRPPRPWEGVRSATEPGPRCLQPGPGGVAGSEDCLYLNVQSSEHQSAPLPVMVFVHGGGFTVGTGADYDTSRLTSQGDVVVVTVNYRLGALGFLDHPSLDDPAAGNFALAD